MNDPALPVSGCSVRPLCVQSSDMLHNAFCAKKKDDLLHE